MKQDFSLVTEEELAQLFPILLEPYNPKWKIYFLQEKKYLHTVFGDSIVRINHIGSSSVEGLMAKPTVDILLEVKEDTDIEKATETLLDAGYIVNTPKRDIIMYLKGYTPKGFQGQAVHIHVRHPDDWGELYFRDYLFTHPDIAAEYAKLKVSLKEKYPHNRDGYTDAKGEFIRKYTDMARQEYAGKYQIG
ncbi:GrpB family protein [Paenibacillus macerans]|uniref:GrpB family protein n=1 Tax=Paenibacillus macerans TaxID=44252 RepID=UPI003D315B1F